MSDALTSDQVEALMEGLCSAFWNKRPLRDFLRRAGVSDNDLRNLHSGQTKRDFLRWLFQRYEATPGGRQLMREMALALSAKTVFPDLEPDQIKVAKMAIEALKPLFPGTAVKAQHPVGVPSPQQAQPTPVFDTAKHRTKLEKLLIELGSALGGRGFEDWFVGLANDCGMKARAKYSTQTRELDGSIEVDHAIYVLELKFTSDKSDSPAVGDFVSKVQGHAAGTLGLFVGMSGFTKNAVAVASRAGSPVVLMDGAHLYRVLHGAIALGDLIKRLRRHALETGEAYMPASLL